MRTISFIKNYNNNHILVHKMKTDCIQCHLLDYILLIRVEPFLVGIKQFRRKKTRYSVLQAKYDGMITFSDQMSELLTLSHSPEELFKNSYLTPNVALSLC